MPTPQELLIHSFVQAISDAAGGNRRYTLRKSDAGNACVFLDGKQCSIYADRPAQVQPLSIPAI